MPKYVVEALPITQIFLGEGPHWDEKAQKLYYVDIFAKAVHRYDPVTGKETKVVIQEKGEGEDSVTLVVPVEGEPNKFIISLGRSLRVLEWDGESGTYASLKPFKVVRDENPNGRFNDGKCDSSGRLWAGTMGYYKAGSFGPNEAKKGQLYRLEKSGDVSSPLDKVDISNGLAWSLDNKTFYYVDSLTYLVEAFDYDILSGDISKRRPIFDLKANNIKGIPDGMTIDSNGNLWVAVFGAGKILHIDPKTGKLIDAVELPASNITSVAFGGPNLDVLYATSAQKDLSKDELAAQPSAGAIFKITNTGVKGLAPGVAYGGKV